MDTTPVPAVPATSNLLFGTVVPIPTLPKLPVALALILLAVRFVIV